MKRKTILIGLFCLAALLTTLNLANGRGSGKMISSALVRTGSPTPTPSGKANANIPAKAAANTKANANTTVAPAKVGNTNINADTSNRDRVANMNSNSAPKMLTLEECTAKLKEAMAKLRGTKVDSNKTVAKTDGKPTIKTPSKDKIEKKAKPIDSKMVKTPKSVDPKMVKHPKLNKPTASKPKTVAKKDSKSITKSEKKPSTSAKKRNKVTPNLDDLNAGPIKSQEKKEKGKGNPPPTLPVIWILANGQTETEVNVGDEVKLAWDTGSATDVTVTDWNGNIVDPKGTFAYKAKESHELTITAKNVAGTATDKVSIIVNKTPLTYAQAKWEEFKNFPSLLSSGTVSPTEFGKRLVANPFTGIPLMLIAMILVFFIGRWIFRKLRGSRVADDLSIAS